jgi:hypothetical protein
MEHLMHTLEGEGRLEFENQHSTSVKYLLLVYQNFVDAGDELIPGLKRVSGFLQSFDRTYHAGAAKLTLNDQRQVNGILRDRFGSFEGSGPIMDRAI